VPQEELLAPHCLQEEVVHAIRVQVAAHARLAHPQLQRRRVRRRADVGQPQRRHLLARHVERAPYERFEPPLVIHAGRDVGKEALAMVLAELPAETGAGAGRRRASRGASEWVSE